MRVIVKPLGLIVVLGVFAGLAVPAFRGLRGGKSAPSAAQAGGTLLIITDASKKSWLQNQIYRFNSEHDGKLRVVTRFMDSRAALQAIVNGKEKPQLWAPSGSTWVNALADSWARDGGKGSIDLGDPGSFRSYLRTPLVFLTTKEKAVSLRPLLGGTDSWNTLHDLASGKRDVPWGKFTFSYGEPTKTNSGFMAMGMFLSAFGSRSGDSANLSRAATSTAFVDYLKDMRRGFVSYDDAIAEDSTLLTDAFVENPSRCDVMVTYESNALAAASKNKNLAVIYPNPTGVSEQVVAVVGGGWSSASQKAGAQLFLKHLASPESLKDGVRSRFRPVSAAGAPTLDEQFSKYKERGFQSTYSAVEFPAYAAVNDAVYQSYTKASQ